MKKSCLNQWPDFDQTGTDISLHGNTLRKDFGDPDLIFQGHQGYMILYNSMKKPFLHFIF